MRLVSVHHHHHPLQVRAERAIGRPQRETAIVTKGRCLTTNFALSHFFDILSVNKCRTTFFYTSFETASEKYTTTRIFYQELGFNIKKGES